MTDGNWLQDLLHWYWITPWQLGLILGLMFVCWMVAMVWMGGRR